MQRRLQCPAFLSSTATLNREITHGPTSSYKSETCKEIEAMPQMRQDRTNCSPLQNLPRSSEALIQTTSGHASHPAFADANLRRISMRTGLSARPNLLLRGKQ
jgi:hypothetical protein